MSFPTPSLGGPAERGPAALVLSFEEARHTVEKHAKRLSANGLDTLGLLQALGRTLGEDIVADRDFPPFPRAARDGYAVRSEDVANIPCELEVIGELKAGDSPDDIHVGRAQAVAIMTGAALPKGSDAIVMVEHTVALSKPFPHAVSAPKALIEISRSVVRGENFVPRAAEARAGKVLLSRGYRFDYAGIAIAASVGKSRVQVYKRPRIAILSTGDELVGIDASPGPEQIRNSNSYSVAAQVLKAGGEPVQLAIAPDEPLRLRSLIEEGLTADLLLLTGGVSIGKYDLVEKVLTEMQAEFYFTGAKIQPGKPVVFGSVPCAASIRPSLSAQNSPSSRATESASARKYFIGLPGNPVSTMVTFELFAKPVVTALSGATPIPLFFPSARLKSEIRTKTGLKRFLPAILTGEFEHAEVELAGWHGSGDIAALARANCYIVIPPDLERIEAGEYVSLLMS